MGGKETRDGTEETCQLYMAVIFGPLAMEALQAGEPHGLMLPF